MSSKAALVLSSNSQDSRPCQEPVPSGTPRVRGSALRLLGPSCSGLGLILSPRSLDPLCKLQGPTLHCGAPLSWDAYRAVPSLLVKVNCDHQPWLQPYSSEHQVWLYQLEKIPVTESVLPRGQRINMNRSDSDQQAL